MITASLGDALRAPTPANDADTEQGMGQIA